MLILQRYREVLFIHIRLRFGLAIKQLRKAENLSQEKFALSIGMDRSYYASVESGKRNISIENILKIADGFHVSLAELFSLVDSIS